MLRDVLLVGSRQTLPHKNPNRWPRQVLIIVSKHLTGGIIHLEDDAAMSDQVQRVWCLIDRNGMLVLPMFIIHITRQETVCLTQF